MSIELMTAAWKSDLPTGRKMVLLSLCDNANDQGVCYPGLAYITKRCGMSERSVQGHIAELQKMGILTCQERVGRSTVFCINPRRFCTPADSAPPQILHKTPAESAPPPADSAPPTPAESAPITEPSLNLLDNHNTNTRAAMSSKIFKVDDVDEQVWTDFCELRKRKKAPLSKTAVDGLRSEAAKAGMTLEAAVRMCCERGWVGFNATWVDPLRNTPGAGRGGGGKRPSVDELRERNRANVRQWAAEQGGAHAAV